MALKVLMAVTGLFFVVFVLFHMYGNLKMFGGPESYNGYAHHLRTMFQPILPYEGLLWILRVLLVLSVIGHVYSAVTLWARAKAARGGTAYKISSGKKVTLGQTYAARTMRWGGITIVVWLVFHLLQFTLLKANVGGDYSTMTPYERMVTGFSSENWWVWAVYFVAILLLALHVRHGVWSALATLGLSTRRRERAYKITGDLVAFALLVGFMAPPTAILLGLIP